MRIRCFLLVVGLVLATNGLFCSAQGFDDLKKAKPVQLNSKLQSLLDKADAKGLEKLLKSKPEVKNEGSSIGKNEKGAPVVVPLFSDIVARTLQGSLPPEICQMAVDAGCDLYTVYNGKTPIYQVMDYLAANPIGKDENGEKVLDILLSSKDFDINRRYRSLPPPLSYLLSENYRLQGGKYSDQYLSTSVIKKILESGARVNTYDEQGASLLLLANSTGNTYLQGYLLDRGINLDKKADESGNNALYAAISSSNVPMLQKMQENYNLKIVVDDLDGHLEGITTEMRDYLAEEASSNAESYDAIVKFRRLFPGKFSLVQEKYDEIALREITQSASYESITLCEKRFPDKTDLTGPVKRRIAERECNAAQSYSQYVTFKSRYPSYKDLQLACMENVSAHELSQAGTIQDVKNFELHYPEKKSAIAGKKSAIYEVDAHSLLAEYQAAKSAVENKYLREPKYDVKAFISSYDGYYDPKELVPSAQMLQLYNTVITTAASRFGPYYTPDNNFVGRYQSDMSKLYDALSSCQSLEQSQLSNSWLYNLLQNKQNELSSHFDECQRAVKLVDQITINNVPRPKYTFSGDSFDSLDFGDFSFTVRNYSKEDYVHFVVHGMKGGKLSGFVAGYPSFEEAVIAGYAAGTYGFARKGGYRYSGGLISGFITSKRIELDLYNARELDQLDSIFESWLH